MDLKDIDTKEIIRRLREFAPNLPDSGFVAGGAVAAIINHIVRGVSPIRDVDLFLPVEFDTTLMYMFSAFGGYKSNIDKEVR